MCTDLNQNIPTVCKFSAARIQNLKKSIGLFSKMRVARMALVSHTKVFMKSESPEHIDDTLHQGKKQKAFLNVNVRFVYAASKGLAVENLSKFCA